MATQPSPVDARYGSLDRLNDARQRTDDLFRIVKEGALYDRPIAERHRIVFYIGHLEAFDWNLLRERLIDGDSFRPEFDKLFSFGIDPVDGGLPADQPSDWPSLTVVRDYVRRIREAIDSGLETALDSSARREFPAEQLSNVAIEHRLMHAETLAYMLHQLPFDRKVEVSLKPVGVSVPIEPEMLAIPEGTATIGLPGSSDIFGWDNEFEQQTLTVPAFEIDKYEVTNGDYLKFISAGGYNDPQYWSDSDWKWKSEHNISNPVFWVSNAETWLLRTMFHEVALPLNAPVYVSHAEASAYAKWAGRHYRPRHSGIVRHTGRRTEWKINTHGGTKLPPLSVVILISRVGIPHRSMHFPRAKAPSACTICWGMHGNGPPLHSLRSRFRTISVLSWILGRLF